MEGFATFLIRCTLPLCYTWAEHIAQSNADLSGWLVSC